MGPTQARRVSCACPKPRNPTDPRKQGACQCGKVLDPAWVSSDATFNEFFGRLREAIFPVVGAEFDSFVAQCKQRELAGRDTFGFEYLARSNITEAYEE